MRLRDPRLWLSLVSLAAVALVAFVDLRRSSSPGPVHPTHAQEKELRGRRGCPDCHGAEPGCLADACLDCHKAVAAQLREQHGLHGSLEETLAQDCCACHLEHLGDAFPLISDQSFLLAGSRREDFDHATVDFRLSGKHAELACQQCHPDAELGLMPKGRSRFLAQEQRCESCHEDPHQGRMRRACADCHGQEQAFDQVAVFEHDSRFPLAGAHAGRACKECHPKDSLQSVEALDRGVPEESWRACQDCHESPHAPGFVLAAAREQERPPEASCEDCHPVEGPAFDRAKLSAGQHLLTGFALAPPHDQAECTACHLPAGEELRWSQRFPGRDARSCAACHDDPHRDQFAGGPFGDGCLSCHQETAWKPPAFDAERHDQAAFALTGAHRRTECRLCHLDPPAASPRRFRGIEQRCENCHQDAHRGAFAEVAAALPPVPEGECARCHDTEAFRALRGGAFVHRAWTGFELTGAHAQSGCEVCHGREEPPQTGARSLGRVAERFPGAGDRCVRCHADPHRGIFDRASLPRQLEGRLGCARCHRPVSFRALALDSFDHQRWTGYALKDQHAVASCNACHAPLRQPDALGRRHGFARGQACADCHADPHVGQFAVAGRSDCARCHDETGFQQPRFDHQTDSRFPLDANHVELDCARCHKPWPLAGGGQAVRYKPLGIRCQDCHGFGSEGGSG